MQYSFSQKTTKRSNFCREKNGLFRKTRLKKQESHLFKVVFLFLALYQLGIWKGAKTVDYNVTKPISLYQLGIWKGAKTTGSLSVGIFKLYQLGIWKGAKTGKDTEENKHQLYQLGIWKGAKTNDMATIQNPTIIPTGDLEGRQDLSECGYVLVELYQLGIWKGAKTIRIKT